LTVLAVIHGLALGADLRRGRRSASWPYVFWVLCLAVYVVGFVWVKLVRRLWLRRRRFTVAAVTPVGRDTVTLELERPGAPLRHEPGQFAFLRLHADAVSGEGHPFTIASAPTEPRLRFTIKASGDYTARVPDVKVGDRATVHGSFGHFSYRFKGGSRLLMIAGGVGITPMLSMLRHLEATGDPRPVTLIWGVRSEADILYRQELAKMAARRGNLRIVYVLSEQTDAPGERGFIDRPMLDRLLGPPEREATVFLCGPPVMMRKVSAALHGLGIPRRRVHVERFSF